MLKKHLLIVGLSAMLAGCGGTSQPYINFINGAPFLVGGDDCVFSSNNSVKSNKIKGLSAIACYDKDKKLTTYRTNMTKDEVNNYYAQQQIQLQREQIQAQEMQALNQTMQQTSRSIVVPNYTPMTVPVSPGISTGGNQIRCIGVGVYATCRTY